MTAASTPPSAGKPPSAKPATTSPWAPFAYASFTVLWTATVVSNVGTWMHDVGAGWLMTELDPSPSVVAMVQAATTLPVFLFALIAGAVADIVDRRKLLILVNLLMGVVATGLAVVVHLEAMTPWLLIAFTFAMGTGAAFVAPAWQAIVPKLVDRKDLSSAIALNSMGINVSRAIGPALAGFLIVSLGIASPFALNALSFIGIVIALIWWRSPASPATTLPKEHVGEAIRAGLRYAINSEPVRATLVRAAFFFLFASAYWAMLPLIARDVLAGGPTLYGLLLASVGAGAVLGALILPSIRSRFGANGTVALGTLGTAIAMASFALAPQVALAPEVGLAAAASALAGVSWIAVLSSLNVSAQTALPDWVRARGLSVFLTVFFGAMAAGSLIWGQIASRLSIEIALLIAAGGAVGFVPLTWAAKLGQGEALNLSPSSHWPEPVTREGADDASGPVMIQIIYQVGVDDHPAFETLMVQMRQARRRSGAYRWSLMQDAESPDRFVETWFEPSWADHLRHHGRVTESDRALQDEVKAITKDEPSVSHHLTRRRKTHTPVPEGDLQ